jgi:hypothetical protein
MLKFGTVYIFRLYTTITRPFLQSRNKLYIEMHAVWDPSTVTMKATKDINSLVK